MCLTTSRDPNQSLGVLYRTLFTHFGLISSASVLLSALPSIIITDPEKVLVVSSSHTAMEVSAGLQDVSVCNMEIRVRHQLLPLRIPANFYISFPRKSAV